MTVPERFSVGGRYPSNMRAKLEGENMELSYIIEEDGSFSIRIDDKANPDFWLQISLPDGLGEWRKKK